MRSRHDSPKRWPTGSVQRPYRRRQPRHASSPSMSWCPSCRRRSVRRPGSAGSTSAPGAAKSRGASSSAACSSSSGSPPSPGCGRARQPRSRRSEMARGSVVKRRSGNYAIVYYVDRKQKWETIGPSRREAERALTARKREVDTGTWRELTSETLAAYAERWLAHNDPRRIQSGRTRLAPSTFAEYRRALLSHVMPRLGARTLVSLRTDDVDALIVALEVEGKAPGTVRNIVTPLRKMLADAVRQGKLYANPAARADLPPAQDFIGKEIPRAHTDAIRGALIEMVPVDPLRNEPDLVSVCFFDVALGTGLRLGELRALRWGDVDRELRVIQVA